MAMCGGCRRLTPLAEAIPVRQISSEIRRRTSASSALMRFQAVHLEGQKTADHLWLSNGLSDGLSLPHLEAELCPA